jgi:hypothetical protein
MSRMLFVGGLMSRICKVAFIPLSSLSIGAGVQG